MVSFTAMLLLAGAVMHAQAQDFSDLVGTWSSKSNSTFTGDGFYNPVDDHFTEPKHPGISYSFSADGYFEESYYRAVANPANPKCPTGIIQWQHGKFVKNTDGSLKLSPIKVDGRQMYSDPCAYKNSVYTRYNATEQFQRYEVRIDDYHKIKRLNLYKHDGSPLMPLYIAYTTPKMLPTTTLNPLVTATATAKAKRGLPVDHEVFMRKSGNMADNVFWAGVLASGAGAVLWWFF
ncbi:Reversal of tor2 lethality [Didymella heteroderae]|uniref:Protein ROT1 n=1 Tax=Didymella heteroderae TaxID=1769908 RepID=A0A9P4WPA7_9PLEO|nr:Reversal of tor2 lethality [Didymella heteroderae]